jgi:hypothetical protein
LQRRKGAAVFSAVAADALDLGGAVKALRIGTEQQHRCVGGSGADPGFSKKLRDFAQSNCFNADFPMYYDRHRRRSAHQLAVAIRGGANFIINRSSQGGTIHVSTI